MTNLPPIRDGRDWSPETWRAGWDESCRRSGCYGADHVLTDPEKDMIIAHATTLLDAGIVKPVVSEAVKLLDAVVIAYRLEKEHFSLERSPAAIAVIQSALDKVRAGG